jgi:Family of unknown function (DUF6295)
MCTMICEMTPISGVGRGAAGWFPVTRANIGYDHATHSQAEHALLLDFVNPELGLDARIALELNIASGKALLATLQQAIEAAEQSGVME